MISSRKKPKKSSSPQPEAIASSLRLFDEQHRARLAKIADLGLVLRGSISQRLMPCGQEACRCQADPPVLHGPYSIWTRKVRGKTVTAMLTREQATRCRPWHRNMRKLDRLVRELQAIGLHAAATLRRR